MKFKALSHPFEVKSVMFQLELGAPGNKINYPDPCSSDLMQGVLQHLDVGRVRWQLSPHHGIQRRSTELESHPELPVYDSGPCCKSQSWEQFLRTGASD